MYITKNYLKAGSVIASINSIDQLDAAANFLRLARHADIDSAKGKKLDEVLKMYDRLDSQYESKCAEVYQNWSGRSISVQKYLECFVEASK